LIVGSGVGGIVGWLFCLKKDDPSNERSKQYSDFLLDYPQKIYRDFFSRLGLWIRYKYDQKPLIKEMQKFFHDQTISHFSGNDHPLVLTSLTFVFIVHIRHNTL
jgi:patatin-like phospholipase/acyl hydrolase